MDTFTLKLLTSLSIGIYTKSQRLFMVSFCYIFSHYIISVQHFFNILKSFECAKWNDQSYHNHTFMSDTKHNFCRNPDNGPGGPWLSFKNTNFTCPNDWKQKNLHELDYLIDQTVSKTVSKRAIRRFSISIDYYLVEEMRHHIVFFKYLSGSNR